MRGPQGGGKVLVCLGFGVLYIVSAVKWMDKGLGWGGTPSVHAGVYRRVHVHTFGGRCAAGQCSCKAPKA